MHSLNQAALGHAIAADRARSLRGHDVEKQRHRPPPARSRAASLVAQLAQRLDADAARRAIA